MINISNAEIFLENCTKCPTCGKPSWYVMECDCGHTFCKNCTTANNETDAETITLECPKCKEVNLFV